MGHIPADAPEQGREIIDELKRAGTGLPDDGIVVKAAAASPTSIRLTQASRLALRRSGIVGPIAGSNAPDNAGIR